MDGWTYLVVEVFVVVVVEDGLLLRVLHEALHRVPVRLIGWRVVVGDTRSV
jgi:hypothetical protein